MRVGWHIGRGSSLLLLAAFTLALAANAQAETVTQSYTYDDAGRLVGVSQDATDVVYEYDPAGNLVFVPEPAPGVLAAVALGTLLALSRRRRARRAGAGLALACSLGLAPGVQAHDCRHPVIDLFVGSAFDDLLTVEADHHELNTDYTVTVTVGDDTVIQSSPDSFSSINAYLSVYALAEGTASIQTHWFYPGTGVSGDCFTTINVKPLPVRSSANLPNSGRVGDPVNTRTGELVMRETSDLYVAGPMPLFFQRYYASNLRKFFVVARLGNNWRHNFDWSIAFVGNILVLTTADGRVVRYLKQSTISNEWEQQTALDEPFPVIQEILPTENHFHVFDPRKQLVYRFSVPPGDSRYRLVEIRDTHGSSQSLSYDPLDGDLTEVSDGLGRTLFFGYTSEGAATRKLSGVSNGTQTVLFGYLGDDLAGVMDAAGGITAYSYAPPPVPGLVGLLASVTRPEGNTPLVNTWDLEGRVATQTNASGDTTTLSYAPPTTTITDPRANDAFQVHDDDGNLTSASDTLGNTRMLGVDADGHRDSVSYPLGGSSLLTFDAATGLEETVATAEGRTAVHAYVPRNVPPGFTVKDLASITFDDGRSFGFGYDANGNQVTATDRAGATWTRTFNTHGQVLTETNPKGGQWIFTYDSDATLLSIQDPELRLTQFAYDAVKRVVSVTRPDGTTRSFVWDALNRLTSIVDEDGQTTTFNFDGNGNLLASTDPLGNTRARSYDDDDRVVTLTDRNGDTTHFTYDALGGLASADRMGIGTLLWEWDDANRLAGLSLPDGTHIGYAADADGRIAESSNDLGQTETSVYDGDDRIVEHSDHGGRTTTFSYDELGRIETRTEPDGKGAVYSYSLGDQIEQVALVPSGLSVAFTYDEVGDLVTAVDPNGESWSFVHDAQGNLVSLEDPLGRVTGFQHDARNRTSQVDYPGGLGNVQLDYDGVGHLTRRLYSDGVDIVYGRDDLGRVTSLPGVTLDYDAESRIVSANGLTATRRPYDGELESVTLALGRTVTYGLDAAGRVTSVTDWTSATPAMTFSYDAAGQQVGVTRANGVATTFDYDGQGRLASVVHGGLGSVVVTRDLVGRPTEIVRDLPLASLPGVAGGSFAYDAASQVDGFTYDAMGRRTDDGAHAFDWDLATRLTSITQGMEVAALDWDGFGSLTGLTAGGVTRTYVWCYALAFPQMAVEREKGVDRRYFVHDPAGRLLYAVEAATSERRFFHYDERSNTAFVTDDAGTVVASFAYSPYGDVAASGPEAADQPFTFAGEWGGFSLGSLGSIGEGLFVMHRRVYDARTAAFLSRDASFPHLHPLTIDPYQYAARDPLRFFDPAGNEPQSPDAASQNASTGSGLATAAQVVNDVTTTAAVVGSELGDHAEEVAKAANRALGASDTLAGAAGELIEAQRGGSEATAKVLKTAEGYRETFDALDARATKLAGAADTLKTVGKVGNVLGAVDIGSTLWTLFDKNRQANAFRTDMEEQLYRAYVERCVTAVEIYLRAKRSETWLISQLNLSRYALERELLWSNYLGGIDSQIDFWTAVGDIYGSFVPGFGLVGTEAIAESAHRNVWSKVYGN